MSRLETFRLLATYNGWMNGRIYDAAAKLTPAEIAQDRGAFFGSILGTLEHLVVGDTLWLRRFADHPTLAVPLAAVAALPPPTALDQIQFGALEPLRARREMLDGAITEMIEALMEHDLDFALAYRNTRGVATSRVFGLLLAHFFNHQTHHRGQVTTLLSQSGVDVGVTDLLALVPTLD